jgi:hypothetical protein
MSNVATDIAYFIPAKYRKILYTVLFVAGVILTATGAGYVAVGAALPKALVAANAVLVSLSTAVHFMARANVPSESPSAPR